MTAPATGLATTRGSTLLLTALAMLAFASNSVLCRLALKHTGIDAPSFTVLRIASGALMLWFLLTWRNAGKPMAGSWPGALALVVYAAGFSLAYIHLDTGTGALLLFGAVQLSMLLYGFVRGERLGLQGVAGLLLAIAGLLVLLLPGASAPPLGSALLMLMAGFAWAVYSLLGKGSGDPLAATTGNFVRGIPLALACALPFLQGLHFDPAGAGFALLSGAVASGMGYAIWYAAVARLASIQAATVQLSVPILAAAAGILFLGEALTLPLAIASLAVLGGVGLVLSSKMKH